MSTSIDPIEPRCTDRRAVYRRSSEVSLKSLLQIRLQLVEDRVGGVFADPAVVDFTFTPMQDGTFVSIRNFGFSGSADERVRQAIDSAGGFSFVLAGCKAWLEHGIELGLVRDRHPKGLPQT